MPLSMADPEKLYVIARVGGNDEMRLFLGGLGFVPGSEVSVVAESGGNLIVNIKDTRVALCRVQASKIFVQ